MWNVNRKQEKIMNNEPTTFETHNRNKRSGKFKPKDNFLLKAFQFIGSLLASLRGAWDRVMASTGLAGMKRWPLYVIAAVGTVWMFWGSISPHLPPTKDISSIAPVTVTSDTVTDTSVTTNPTSENPAIERTAEPLREAPVLVVTEPVPVKPVPVEPKRPVSKSPANPHNAQTNAHGIATVLPEKIIPEKIIPKTTTEPTPRRKASTTQEPLRGESIDDGSLMRKLHRLREKVNQLRDHLNNEKQRTAKLKSLLSQSDKQVKSLTDRVLVQTKLITNFKRIVGLAKEKILWLERKSSLPTVKKTRPTSRYKLVGGRDMRGQGPPDYEIQLFIQAHEHKVEVNKYRRLLGLPLRK